MSSALKLSWVLAALVLVGALAVGAFGESEPRTQQERVYDIAAQVKCPQCAGQTAADSDTSSARGIRRVIATDLQDGLSTDAILDHLAESYGNAIVLTPTASGVTGLVWVLPVVFGVAATAGLIVVFRRWSTAGMLFATDADRSIVDDARADRHPEPDGKGSDETEDPEEEDE